MPLEPFADLDRRVIMGESAQVVTIFGSMTVESFEYSSRVGADGALDLHVNLGPAQANREVRIVVQPVEIKPTQKMSQEEWVEFIKSTAGSIDDPTFIRHDQGQFEDRGEIFP